MVDLAIVIVSHNVRQLLKQCLSSVDAARSSLTVEVWVVDNGSTDGTPDMVRSDFPTAHLVETGNVGFSRGNNLALTQILASEIGLPRYVLLLNPDTSVTPSALVELIGLLDARPDVGAAGPKLVRPDGSLDLACRRSFPTPAVSFYHFSGLARLFPRSPRFGQYNLTFLDPNGVYEVDSVVGACMLVRGQLLRDVGLLDEAFFMYGEDLDWALRIKRAGWRILYAGNVTVYHYKRASSRQRSTQSLIAFYEAMLIFFRKHYARQTAWPVRWSVIAAIYLRAGLALAANRARSAERARLPAPR
jgi:GT2 family glycosyltransferase